MDIKKETFCIAPFTHLSTKTNGSIKACCRSLPALSNIKKESLLQAWNNEEMKQLRNDIINGVKNKRCDVCWKLEDVGAQSLRMKYNTSDQLTNATTNLKSLNEDYTLNNKPTWIEFKLSNLCNFKCRMCHPMDSTRWFEDYKKIAHLHDDNWQKDMINLNLTKKSLLKSYSEEFFENLPELMSNVDSIWFAGGEPLYDDDHYRILDSIIDRADKITLSYATNLSMLSNKKYNVVDYWKKFKRVTISVSLDGPHSLNEYIRSGADSKVIEDNIRLLQQLPNVVVTGKMTVQALNIYYVPETFEWFKSMGVSTGVHFVTWPNFLDGRIWTGEARQEIKEKLELYLQDQDTPISKRLNVENSINDIVKFFNGTETFNDSNWSKFLEYNKTLDTARNETFKKFEFLQKWMK
jgi:sulfatase maturation enzyme AslB (radical SAM superfamily)